MRRTTMLRVALLVAALAASGSSVAATTRSLLAYVSPATARSQQVTLRRRGADLELVDTKTRALLAHALAGTVRRVSVRGADRHDDELTLDLSQPFDLPDGIDYDGGEGGWDTLVIHGGHALAERIMQRTPHDGSIVLDGLTIRYANLEPVVDTTPASTFTVQGTVGADTIRLSDGPGAGELTVSSPSFESVTFANKANVVIDGQGGGDSVVFDNPTPPAGLTSLIVRNVASVSQTAALNYAALGIDATGAVTLNAQANGCANVEIQTQNGDIAYLAAGDVTIGGVSAALSGARVANAGSVKVDAAGTITLADSDGTDILHAGATLGYVQATAGVDVTASVDNAAATSPTGMVVLNAGRDVLLGTAGSNFRNDVRADTLADLRAGRDVTVTGSTQVVGTGSNGGRGQVDVYAQRDFNLSNATGTTPTLSSPSQITISAHGAVNLQAGGASALSSPSYVVLYTDRLMVGPGAGISALIFDVFTFQAGLDLGSDTDSNPIALEIGNAEANRISAQIFGIFCANGHGHGITVSQPLAVAYALDMFTDSGFTATGNGSLSASTLQFADSGGTARTWTFDANQVQISPGAPIPVTSASMVAFNGGSDSDTFLITPSPTTAVFLQGDSPGPSADPGDRLDVSLSGAVAAKVSTKRDGNGYQGEYNFGNRAAVQFYSIETLGNSTDLSVALDDGVTTERPGGTLTYTLTASNNGPLGVTAASVTDAFPAALGSIAWNCRASAGSTCRANGNGNIAEAVDLAAGGTATFTIAATVIASAASIVDSATIAPPAGVTDTNPADNIASDTDAMAGSADLSLTKTSSQSTYIAGGTIAYTIALGNAGPDAASGVTLIDALPAGTTFASLAAPASFSCTTPAVGSNGTISCSAGSVAPATNTFALKVNVAATASGPIVNSASVASASIDPNGANNAASATVVAAPAVTVAPTPVLSQAMRWALMALVALIALLRLRHLR